MPDAQTLSKAHHVWLSEFLDVDHSTVTQALAAGHGLSDAASEHSGQLERAGATQGLKQGLMRTAFKTAKGADGKVLDHAKGLENESKAGTVAAGVVAGAIDLNKVAHGKMTGGEGIVDTAEQTGAAYIGNEAGRVVEKSLMKGGAKAVAEEGVEAAAEEAGGAAATEGAVDGGLMLAGVAGAEEGAEIGAVIGSVEPGGGTAVGMVAGMVIGAAVTYGVGKLLQTKEGKKLTAEASHAVDTGLHAAEGAAHKAEQKLDKTKAGHAVIGATEKAAAAAAEAEHAAQAAAAAKLAAAQKAVAAAAAAKAAEVSHAAHAVADGAKSTAGKVGNAFKKLF